MQIVIDQEKNGSLKVNIKDKGTTIETFVRSEDSIYHIFYQIYETLTNAEMKTAPGQAIIDVVDEGF